MCCGEATALVPSASSSSSLYAEPHMSCFTSTPTHGASGTGVGKPWAPSARPRLLCTSCRLASTRPQPLLRPRPMGTPYRQGTWPSYYERDVHVPAFACTPCAMSCCSLLMGREGQPDQACWLYCSIFNGVPTAAAARCRQPCWSGWTRCSLEATGRPSCLPWLVRGTRSTPAGQHGL